jgi:hypothetical protein
MNSGSFGGKASPRSSPFGQTIGAGATQIAHVGFKVARQLNPTPFSSFGIHQSDRILAVHVEFKHPTEAFSFGQPEAYPLRAACFVKTHGSRATLNRHHDWATVVFCGPETLTDVRLKSFQRVITHGQAARMLAKYPILK